MEQKAEETMQKMREQKEPQKQPVSLPTPEELEEYQNNRKAKKTFQQQAILYGVDMLEQETKQLKQYYRSLPSTQKGVTSKTQTKRSKIDHERFKETFSSLEDKKDSTEHSPKSGEIDYLAMLVIGKDSDWKTIFDIVMLFASVYSTFSQAYYAAFGPAEKVYLTRSPGEIAFIKFMDETVEISFYLDFIFCFL